MLFSLYSNDTYKEKYDIPNRYNTRKILCMLQANQRQFVRDLEIGEQRP